MDANDDDHVLLTTFPNAVEASIARDLLDNAGIEGFISDDQIMTNHPLLGSAVGGVKLWVRESDAADAVEALQDAPDDVFDSEESVQDMEPSDRLPASVPTCPACASQEIGFDMHIYVYAAVMILCLAVPVITPLEVLDGVILSVGLFFIGQWLFILRIFPLRCNECGESGRRGHFEGNYPRAE